MTTADPADLRDGALCPFDVELLCGIAYQRLAENGTTNSRRTDAAMDAGDPVLLVRDGKPVT
jgi:hypothetical protein